MADSPSPTLRVKDVVAEYGLSDRYVRHLVQERRIPHYKIGRNLCFDRKQIEAWLADQHVEAVQ